jgi:hypothetical protein
LAPSARRNGVLTFAELSALANQLEIRAVIANSEGL